MFCERTYIMNKTEKISYELITKVNDLLIQRKTTELEQLIKQENLSDGELEYIIICLVYGDWEKPITISELEYNQLLLKVRTESKRYTNTN